MKTSFETEEEAQKEAEKTKILLADDRWTIRVYQNIDWYFELQNEVLRVGPSSGTGPNEPYYVAEATLQDKFLSTDAGGIGIQYFAWADSPKEAVKLVAEKAIKGTSENVVKLEKFKLGLLGFPLKKD